MRRLVLLAGILSLSTLFAATGAAEAAEITLKPRWNVGDVCDLRITKSIEDKKGAKIVREGKVSSVVRLTVREADTDGYLLEWRTLKVQGGTDAPAAEVKAVERVAQKLVMLIEVDVVGGLRGLRNLEQLRAEMEPAIRTLAPPGEAADAAETVRRLFADEALATRMFLKDVQTLFAPLGITLRPGSPINVSTTVPNPLNGPPLPFRGTIALESFDPPTRRATVATVSSLDPDKAPTALRETLKQLMTGPLAYGPGERVPDWSLSMDERAEHVMDSTTGWPVRIRHRRIIGSDDRRRMEGLWIEATVRPAGSGATATVR